MPELPEVHKLQQQLIPAWVGRSLKKLSTPQDEAGNSPCLSRFFPQLPEVVGSLQSEHRLITSISRLGKHLWISFDGDLALHLHLSSTGWLMPANDRAKSLTRVDLIYQNFLHSINAKNVRVNISLSDGQEWNYHDPRTWGEFLLKKDSDSGPRTDARLAEYGPDWMDNPFGARQALINYKGRRKLKDVLTDQEITCGLGNYLACEIAWLAGLHPHITWADLYVKKREEVGNLTTGFLAKCLELNDHSHWNVFKRMGEDCRRCGNGVKIGYTKDGKNSSRGSYFCPKCQLA